MWTVPAPTRSAASTFELCIERIRDADLKARLVSITDEIEGVAEEYDVYGQARSLCSVAPSPGLGNVSAAELIDLYTGRLVPKRSPGRVVYEELMSAPQFGRCPFCGHRQVSTLDHFLPKGPFAGLSVAPMNLIPACPECNKVKLEMVPNTEAEVLLHPYFDDVEDCDWLVASVVERMPPAVVFSVDSSAIPDALMRLRVHGHFDALELGSLYSSQAADELLGVRHAHQQLLGLGGAAILRDHLGMLVRSRRRHRVNSWQGAMYASLAGSDWYCEGGFVAE